MSAPRPEGMSEERLDEIRHRMVQREPVDQADRVDLHRQRLIDASDLIVEVRRLRADGATLRERVKKLPTPVNPENDFNRQHVHVWYCRWCGESWLRNATTSDADHPNNGCLWSDVHKSASAPKEPTPRE